MKSMIIGLILAGAVVFQTHGTGKQNPQDAATATYEHLATAIIEIRATEDGLVRGILQHHYGAALRHLDAAKAAQGPAKATHLESAAGEIAHIANEGDKPVQAIRQRLLKAGHHHHTDAETKADYIFIDGKEKKSLLDLAGKTGKLGGSATNDAIAGVATELSSIFDKAVVDE